MLNYILRRVLLFVPTLAAVWVILFTVLRAVGDPAAVKLGQHASPESIAYFRQLHGLERPRYIDMTALALAVRYAAADHAALDAAVHRVYAGDLRWYDEQSPRASLLKRTVNSQLIASLADKLRLDFGMSVAYNRPVGTMLAEGLVPSLSVTVPMFVLGLVVSVYLSMFCALYRAQLIDHTITFVAIVLMSLSMPAVILLIQHLAARLDWFPVSGYAFGWRAVGYVAVPVFIGVLLGLGNNTRFYRSVLIEEIRRDYVRTAYAKGLARGVVLFKHVLKNAMIPIVTRVVIAIPFLYAGSFLLETFFGIPGLGSMAYEALYNADYVVLEAITFIGTVLFMVANLVCDILYVYLDPRIRLN